MRLKKSIPNWCPLWVGRLAKELRKETIEEIKTISKVEDIKAKKTIPSHIIVQLLKTKDKAKKYNLENEQPQGKQYTLPLKVKT